MRIALASDHGGFELKGMMIDWLKSRGIETEDLGTYDEESVDYPEYGWRCAEAVVRNEADKGLVFCGTGIGISMAANKVKGARCAVVTSDFTAEMAKAHNGANLLAFGGRTTTIDDAVRWTSIWLDTEVDESERHARRRRQLDEMPHTT